MHDTSLHARSVRSWDAARLTEVSDSRDPRSIASTHRIPASLASSRHRLAPTKGTAPNGRYSTATSQSKTGGGVRDQEREQTEEIITGKAPTVGSGQDAPQDR